MAETIILSYHNFVFEDNKTSEIPDDYYTISVKKFVEQINIIQANNIPILTPNDLLNGYSPKSTAVILTFDDGHSSHFRIAQEVLIPQKLSGLFFPITSELGLDGKMDENQLKFLIENGNQIGSHSHTHSNFEKLEKEAKIVEILNSKVILERKTGEKVNFFAFPFGCYTEECILLLQEIRIQKCFSTKGIPNNPIDEFLLHRINISKGISDRDFERIIKGDSTFFEDRNRKKKYQKALRSLLGNRVESRIKEIIKRS